MAPTQRPFFSNFFSAFRARTTTNPTFQAKSAPTVGSPTSLSPTAHAAPGSTTASQPRTITTKTSDSPTPQQNVTSPTRSTAVPFSPSTTRYAPPLSRSPGTASPGTNPNLSMSPPGASTPITRGRQRRGSDSSNSSAGFMDALGPEKWYVGGRNASGEETFYRLGMVGAGQGKRVRSLDRLSL
ncbi:uncharacterized protein HMPREF1541_01355 [Cyphellophora europaea CBS 101466]|uniref:Uncharacterized protein n=1 Tax=Cyphellophora europaea (strain CBS 101466) TaxID=1220924 RepID=W2SH14_CYPE1|nr:uncharacterized protein HMPREF1541_01355 [Cyphellophora europaea CBS 101466]ETN47164.1 hypothetical protein HMPREF1541_01355 [Cyphellophora europaea CBS 101466]